MKGILLIFTAFVLQISYAHRGDLLAVSNVQIEEEGEEIIFYFDLENIVEKDLSDVRIEFWKNKKSIAYHQFKVIPAFVKFTASKFVFPKDMIDLDKDQVQIEITEIYGKKHDWGGWDGPVNKQTNTLYSEFYADAPWRMKRENGMGEANDVPVHFFLHDADLVIGYTMKIDYIDIKVKNASTNTFGSTLKFDSLSTSEFQSLFSCVSTDDPALNVQGFDLSAFTATSSHTIDFDGESDFIDDFVSVDATYWYFTINLPGVIFESMEDVIDVEATISYANTLITDDDVIRMRIFRSAYDIPQQANFFRGDTHLHSMFTQNDAEIGLPLCSTKEAASLIGLDWITTTDHTSDFDNYGNGNIQDNWNIIQDQASVLNADDPSMIYIAGQEVAVNNSKNELVHMLVYPSYMAPYSLPFLGDGNGDLSATSVSIDNVVNNMASADAFSYCAHPFSTGDKLPDIPVNGGIWNLGDIGFPANGDDFPLIGGEIICNDQASPSDILSASPNEWVKEGIRGTQIWNIRWTLDVSGLSGDELDPYDVTNSGNPMAQVDTADHGFYMKRFRQGQEIVNFINQKGLYHKNTDASILNWKLYYSAGSDAHGSFNSSNTDDFGGTGEIHNNAVGKLNTLVYCPNGMGNNGENVLRSLYNGNSTISDGPMITIGISTDGDNPSNEVIMGQDSTLNYNNADGIFLNINYTTTPEFGDVEHIKFIVGTMSGETSINITPSAVNGNHNESFNLLTLIDSALGSASPTGEYLYVRAELETLVDYTGDENIYRTHYDQFHSFSNPIWINWDVYAGSNDLTAKDKIEVFPNPTNGSLIVKAEGNILQQIYILNSLGQVVLVEQPISSVTPLHFEQFAAGLYTVQCITADGDISIHKVIKE